MIRLSKRLSVVMVALFMVICSSIPAFAESSNKLIDEASLFDSYEYSDIESQLEDLSYQTGWDVIIYTNERYIDAYEMEEVCNDYYDMGGFGKGANKSGIMLTVDMGSREMYILTKGDTMYYFNDERTDAILDNVVSYLSDDEYYDATQAFIDDVSYYYNAGKPVGGEYSNIEEESSGNILISILKDYGIIFAIVAIVIAALAVVFTSLRYKNHGKAGTYDLQANSVTNLSKSEDIFLHKSVSVQTISSSSSSGRSSSGGGGSSSHGGGGRSF